MPEKDLTLEEQNQQLREQNRQLQKALETAVKVCDEAFVHWDADRDMKVGKYLNAMSGGLKGYRADIDEMHATRNAAAKTMPLVAEGALVPA